MKTLFINCLFVILSLFICTAALAIHGATRSRMPEPSSKSSCRRSPCAARTDFKARRVEKEYVALAWGVMPKGEGAIDRPIGRHRSQRKKMSSVRALARVREALTNWRVEEVFPSGAVGGRFGKALDCVQYVLPRIIAGRPHRDLHLHLIGNDIVLGAAMD